MREAERKGTYSLSDYLEEGRLLESDDPHMLIEYVGVLGMVKVMECILTEKDAGDMEPLRQALKEIEENGDDNVKVALRFIDCMGAHKRAERQGKEFLESDYIHSAEGKKGFSMLKKVNKQIEKENRRDRKTMEELQKLIVEKREKQWADEFTERAEEDMKKAEEYEKAGDTAAANKMREEARKNHEIAEEMRMHLENGTLFDEE